MITAESTAGVRLRLRTNSDVLVLTMEHIPNLMRPAACAYDLVTAEGVVLRKDAQPTGDRLSQVSFHNLGRQTQVVELWLPAGAGVRLWSLEFEDGAFVEPEPDLREHWVAYGSSITHCAWVPGPTETWPSIVARRLGWQLTSLGFNGNCQLDPLVAEAMAALSADRFILEVGINIHNLQTLRERTFGPAIHGFLTTLRRAHPTTPITLMSPIISPSREDSPITDLLVAFGGDPRVGDLSLKQMRSIMQDIVDVRRARGDAAITYLDGRSIFGEADLDRLPDGLHPDTEGYALMADRLCAFYAPHLSQP